MIKRLLLAIAVIVSTTGLHWLEEPYLVSAFEKIALRSEYKPGKSQPIRKWLGPVRIYIDSRIGFEDIQTRLVDEHIATLHTVIDLPIRRVKSRKNANMVVLFEHSDKLSKSVLEYYKKPPFSEELLKKSVCIARMHIRKSGEIVRVFIAIPPDKARRRGKLPACVVEEITQGLGLPNDSDEVYPSIFNDKSIDEKLSPVDRLLLKILYDPRLKPGMKQGTVRPLARDVVQKALPAMREKYKSLMNLNMGN